MRTNQRRTKRTTKTTGEKKKHITIEHEKNKRFHEHKSPNAQETAPIRQRAVRWRFQVLFGWCLVSLVCGRAATECQKITEESPTAFFGFSINQRVKRICYGLLCAILCAACVCVYFSDCMLCLYAIQSWPSAKMLTEQPEIKNTYSFSFTYKFTKRTNKYIYVILWYIIPLER